MRVIVSGSSALSIDYAKADLSRRLLIKKVKGMSFREFLQFNRYLGLVFACPITSTKRDFPFHIAYNGKNIRGFIMTEQLKSIDYNARKIKFVEKADNKTQLQVLGIIESILK